MNCVWHYDFNGSKNGVLITGDNKKENKRNALLRSFMLGNERVKEKVNYDFDFLRMIQWA